MWTSLSTGWWICLLFQTAVAFDTLSEEQGTSHMLLPPCCMKAGPYTREAIVDCIKQEPNPSCPSKNYAVKVSGGKWRCISFDSKWMKAQIKKGNSAVIDGFKPNVGIDVEPQRHKRSLIKDNNIHLSSSLVYSSAWFYEASKKNS